jgi:RNA polymerase sigma factor (TIGR02999 family)
MDGPANDVTLLLREWSAGNDGAFERLIPLVYEDLSRLAHGILMGERAHHTLNTQALVHESYLRLVGKPGGGWQNRSHFFAIASRAMRRVLIDSARRRKAGRRGGGAEPVTWTDGIGSEVRDLDDLLALDEALDALAANHPRMGRIVECRFFGGMTVDETAEALNSSPRTVERDWARAKIYLFRELDRGPSEPGTKS